MTTPTQNGIPSSAAIDVRFNAEKLDEIVNSDNETYSDRFGNSRFTLKGLATQVQGFFDKVLGSDGADYIPLKQGGKVGDAIVSVHVDSFGADPSGLTDSTQAVKSALAAISTVTGSPMNGSVDTTYASLVFGNGKYVVGDIPLYSGIWYKGQGAFETILIPKAGAEFVFTTVGTKPYETYSISYRLFRTIISDLHIGCGYQNVLNGVTIPTGVGGIRIYHASYVTIENVYLRHLDGMGFDFGSLWDSETFGLRAMYVGNCRDSSNPAWAFRLWAADAATDGSNANRFWSTHIEGCPADICVDLRSRHNFFFGGKIEKIRYNDANAFCSSVIRGADSLVFCDFELTSVNVIHFMFEIVGTTTVIDTSADDVSDPNCDHSRGVVFMNPHIIDSNALSGDYFKTKSDRGRIKIIGGYARHARYLISGSDVKISDMDLTQCGPTIGLLQGNTVLQGVTIGRSRVPTSGSFSVFTVTGNSNKMRFCEFGTIYGSTTNNGSWITVNSSTELQINDLEFSGSMQNGISGSNATQQRKFRNVRLASGATYGSLINGGYPYDGLPTKIITDTGYAVSNRITVPVDGTVASPATVGGASSILVRVENASSVAIASGRIFGDASFATLKIESDIQGNLSVTGVGVSGDGKIYLSQSNGALSITNRTSGTITVYILTINAK